MDYFMPPPDVPQNVLLGFSMIMVTVGVLWMIVIAYGKARIARNRTHGWILLSFIFIINAVIIYIIGYYRRELVSFLSHPTVLITILVPISYVLYAIYKRGPPYFRFNPYT